MILMKKMILLEELKHIYKIIFKLKSMENKELEQLKNELFEKIFKDEFRLYCEIMVKLDNIEKKIDELKK